MRAQCSEPLQPRTAIGQIVPRDGRSTARWLAVGSLAWRPLLPECLQTATNKHKQTDGARILVLEDGSNPRHKDFPPRSSHYWTTTISSYWDAHYMIVAHLLCSTLYALPVWVMEITNDWNSISSWNFDTADITVINLQLNRWTWDGHDMQHA